ncbi:fungal-specific transcription factor domain-containing protein [Xylariaceae sp. FL1272]|nr:fungal-specific transcription factor domain-containing protein [Xylariaceae sp. FL1272]
MSFGLESGFSVSHTALSADPNPNSFGTPQRPPRQLPGPASADGKESVVTGEPRNASCVPIQGFKDLQKRLNEQNGANETAMKQFSEASSQPLKSDYNEKGAPKSAQAHYQMPTYMFETANISDPQYWAPQLLDTLSILSPVTSEQATVQRQDSALPVSDLRPLSHESSSSSSDGMHLSRIICTDLDQLFFDRVYQFAPIIHKFRYISWSQDANKSKQRVSLQYAMRTLSAAFSSQFQAIRDDLYTQARQTLDILDMETQNDRSSCYPFSIEQIQAWILLAIYEWMTNPGNYQCGMVSAGRALRLAQMMRLYNIDEDSTTVVKLPTFYEDQKDWVDLESRRRTFWLAYTIDRFTNTIDGLCPIFDERQIRTRLPASETDFVSGTTATAGFLAEAIRALEDEQPTDTSSPFIQSIIAATICGRVLEHRHRSPITYQCQLGDQQPERTWEAVHGFCNQHRSINALLAQHQRLLSAQNLSEHTDPLMVFVVLTEYMAVFMLYETIEYNLLGPGIQAKHVADSLSTEQKQQLMDAVRDLQALTTRIGQLNYFQTSFVTAGNAARFDVLLDADGSWAVRETHDINNAIVKSGLSGPPLHIHLRQDEFFKVEQGLLAASLDGKEYILTKHDEPLCIRAGTRHRFWSHASATESLVFRGWTDPQVADHILDENFLRNFQGYLADCHREGLQPSPFQLVLFAYEASTVVTPPFWVPLWFLQAAHYVLANWIAASVLG